MCGIAGFVTQQLDPSQATRVVAGMTQVLSHRGPDDGGLWQNKAGTATFGHRRLSIVDLSNAGHQPMTSADGHWTLCYNGEIYNFRELRAELQSLGQSFRGESDTEVLLAALAQWGLARTLPRLNGIFAFALWDHARQTLSLARDHMGIKPLYYAHAGGGIAFASELKAIRENPTFDAALDRNAIASYLRHAYVPDPLTVYKYAKKLEPGCFLTLSADRPSTWRVTRYWDAVEMAESARTDPFRGSYEDAIEALHNRLSVAVGSQLVADVPIGAFLSGGVDSSLVTALMQSHSSRPVQTFSIGFRDSEHDEAPHAKAVARALGTQHTELYVTDQDARNTVPLLADMFDEPFADSSQIPTALVSSLTRDHVTVALSGDGGDELFAGYQRYKWIQNIWRLTGWAPRGLRRAIADTVRAIPAGTLDKAGWLLPARHRRPYLGATLHRLAGMTASATPMDCYRQIVSQWQEPEKLVRHAEEPDMLFRRTASRDPADNLLREMQLVDVMTYLPGDILTKVDRASMAVGLEVRVPLLDREVVELAWRLPDNLKRRNGVSKWALREVLHQYAPKEIIERPKRGFSVPLGHWLRGPLKDWAEALLTADSLEEDGLINAAHVQSAWRAHIDGRADLSGKLWNILMLQSWRRRWLT